MSTSPRSGPRIFVSHSQADNDFGIKLVDDLRRALGDENAVWYDVRGGLLGGDTWWPKIAQELRSRNVFIVVLSPAGVSSKWVNDEINLAWLQRNKTGMLIIPLLYRKCVAPEYLSLVQMISFLPPRTYQEAFNDLLKTLGLVNQLIAKPEKSLSILTPLRRTTAAIKRISKERIIQLVASLVIVASLVFSSVWIDLSVAASHVASASRIAMATSIATHYPFSDHLALHDPLANASQHDKWDWDTQDCLFTNQGYLDEELAPDYFNACFASKTNFANFTYEVMMIITEGDCGSLLFRANTAQSSFYLFSLCQDGYYYVGIYGNKFPNNGKTLIDYSPSGVDIGLNYPVSFAVVARSKTISLFVNGTYITHVSNSIYSQGEIGVAANALNVPTQVIFSNARVWTL